MPRAGDLNPQSRGANDIHNPLRGLLDYSAIGMTAGAAGDQIKSAIDGTIDEVVAFIKDTTGIDLSGPAALIEGLIDVPLGLLSGTPLGTVLSMLGAVFPFLQGAVGGGGFDPVSLIEGWISGTLLPAGLLGSGSPLNAGNLFGSIGTELLSVLPVGSLSSVAPNRVPNPGFTADAILPASDWSVDMTTSHTAGDGTGAAHVVADGHRHTLITGKTPTDRIPVGPGQKFPALIYVSHADVVVGSGGPPVRLLVFPYNGDTPLDEVVVASYTPATPTLAWPGFELVGSYQVPDTGVTSVQMGPDVTEQALQGDWWFDDGSAAQAADMSVIPGLPPALQVLKANADALLNGIETVASGVPVIGSTVDTAIEALKHFNPLAIGGSQGGANLPGDLGTIMDMLVGGLRGKPVTGSSPADLYAAASQVATNVANTDVTTNLDISGSFPIQSWANWLDVAGVARGQDGQPGNVIEFGQGGQPGKFGATMWHRGVDFDSGVTQVNFTVNADGSIRFDLPAGTATTAKSLTMAAGSGTQSPHFASGYQGIGLGLQVFNAGNFVCGGNQTSPGAKGLGPGGGGAGSLLGPAGKGAGPRGWVRQRANAITGQVSGYDTVAPTNPTPHVFAVSNSVITVYGTGSVDTDSGLAGVNVYLRTAGVDTKQNDTPIALGTHFDVTALTPNTDYQASLFMTATDNAGNETAKVSFAGTGAVTLNPTPATSPMPSDKATAIRALVAAAMAASDPATGVTISIRSPFGFMDESFGANTGVDKHFLTASQTKMLTGYKIAMLVDAGTLHLGDHLSTYLSGYPVDPTIQQMLQMQSGLYDYESSPSLGQNFTLNPTMAMTVDQIIAIIKAGGTGPSVFPPGTSYFYTNSAYYVLGKIIEAVDPAHRPYDQIIAQDIFAPLGMVNSRIRMDTGTPPAPYAIGQDFDPVLSVIYGFFGGLLGPPPRRDVSNQNPAFIWAAGAWDSVMSDMMLFLKELRDGTLISAGMKAQRMSTFIDQPASPAYGLNYQGPPIYRHGLGILQIGSWFGHDGSWLGYDSCSMFEPQTGTLISVYENFQTGPPHTLAALSTIWYEIASYLYPGSTNQPGYLSSGPSAGTVACTMQKMTAHAEGTVYDPGSFTPFNELYTSGGLAPVTAKPTPTGSTGLWFTGIGEGGPGGTGEGSLNRSGGSGGGGAGRINRIYIPRSELGDTFDVQYGVGATPGNPGGDTIFRSGSIELIAKGGRPGASTPAYQGTAAGGLGGGWTATPSTINGVPVTGVNGQQGGTATMGNGVAGNSDTVNDGAAGGGAGAGEQNGPYAGAKGGDSLTQTGGAGGGGHTAGSAPTDAVAPPPLHGGAAGGGAGSGNYAEQGYAGGHGGKYGGGGGGGSCSYNSTPGPGGPGGDAAALLEWV